MTVRWRFTEAEFYVLCLDRAGEEPPAPFIFTSSTRTPADFEIELREARESLSQKATGDFSTFVDAMTNPDLYLFAYGSSEDDRWGVDSLVCVRAVRKGPKGYVITQLPGATFWRRGGYTVAECDPLRLSDAIVDAMPDAERGRRGDHELADVEGELDHEFGRSAVAVQTDSVAARAAAFMAVPSTTSGEIHIVQGASIYGPRGLVRHRVVFHDLENDGRYAVTEEPARALAVDSSRFVSVLNSRIADVIRNIKDEREGARS
ncbi:ESX secretion-associated protein EspG [Nocardia sp. NPDC005978]|uniref:ESX secretion-associated protein EspG n=1 Tax=Nocardia sp. NPDC005978 TaxID=3156725 RepID=UPI0033AFBF51